MDISGSLGLIFGSRGCSKMLVRMVRGSSTVLCFLIIGFLSSFAQSGELALQQAQLTLCGMPDTSASACHTPIIPAGVATASDPHLVCLFPLMDGLRGLKPVLMPAKCETASKPVTVSGDEQTGYLLQTTGLGRQWLTVRYPWKGHHDWMVLAMTDPIQHMLGSLLVQSVLQPDGSMLLTPARVTGYACAGGVRSLQQNPDGSVDLEQNLDDLSVLEVLAGRSMPSKLGDPMQCQTTVHVHRDAAAAQWAIQGMSWQPGPEPFGPGCLDQAMAVYRNGSAKIIEVPEQRFHALFRDYTTCHDQGVAPTISD